MLEQRDEAATGCLSDEELMAFATGAIDPVCLEQTERHLDECETCQRLLSEAACSLATAATLPSYEQDSPLTWNTTFQPGATVGQRYSIRRFIARGGMGEVYEAFDRELQERVALKTVTSTACDNPTAVRRLKGEVQLARRVSHPNVCRMYDFGTHVMADTGAQISFLTMEFVEGETLGARLRSGGALPIAEARRLAKQLLMGLNAAHDAGVLHRDFKSDNVMLKQVNGQACPVILDFGLARAFDHDRGRSVSNAGLVGTISYLAPEQLEGKPHSIASDVYSLGMVWFEMLTGQLPFESGASPAVAALERMQKPAPAPSSRNSAVPADLDAVVGGCLKRSPKQRFKTTAQVLATMAELERRSRPLLTRHRPWLIGAAAFVLTLVLLSLMQHPSSPRIVNAPKRAPSAPEITAEKVEVPQPAPAADAPAEVKERKRRSVFSAQHRPVEVRESKPAPAPRTSPRVPLWEDPFDLKPTQLIGLASDPAVTVSQNSGASRIK